MPLDSSRQLGQTVGAKLRAARQAHKYTQSQLAQPDFSVSYISAIERGQIQPSLRALEILARRLDLSTADLLPQNGQAALSNQAVVVDEVAAREEEWELLLLEAQIALRQGDNTGAIACLLALREQKKKPEQDIQLSTLLGQAYLEGGYLQESEQVLASAAVLAREARDQFFPQILSLQSSVYAAMHNITRAVHLLHESLAALEQVITSDMAFFRAQIYSSLGQHYNALGHYERALAAFEQALAAVRERTTNTELEPVYRSLVQYYREREDLPHMALAVEKWLLTNQQTSALALTSRIQHGLGRAWLKSKSAEAYAYLLEQYQRAESQQNFLGQASASVHLSTWLLEHEDLDRAETFAQEARSLTMSAGETLIAAEAQLLLGEIAYRRGKHEDGDSWFEAGLQALEHLKAGEELIDYLTRYAQQLEARDLIQKAIIYWKKAYGYQQRQRESAL